MDTKRDSRERDSGEAQPVPPLSYRQGDVLLVAVDALPEGAEAESHTHRIVLAEGEVTGHAHVIDAQDAEAFTHDGQRYVLTRPRARLVHEEHAAIGLEPGVYRVVTQREYDPSPAPGTERPQAWRRVAD